MKIYSCIHHCFHSLLLSTRNFVFEGETRFHSNFRNLISFVYTLNYLRNIILYIWNPLSWKSSKIFTQTHTRTHTHTETHLHIHTYILGDRERETSTFSIPIIFLTPNTLIKALSKRTQYLISVFGRHGLPCTTEIILLRLKRASYVTHMMVIHNIRSRNL